MRGRRRKKKRKKASKVEFLNPPLVQRTPSSHLEANQLRVHTNMWY
jgi:hypothetical protein